MLNLNRLRILVEVANAGSFSAAADSLSYTQSAVSQQLTRQITRLLIIAGEFLSESREVKPRAKDKALITLARTEDLLQQAIASRTFSPDDQKELARRIRRRRKELEALLSD